MPFDMKKTSKGQKRSNDDDGNQPHKMPKAGLIIVDEIVPKTQVRPNHAPVKVCIYKYHQCSLVRTSPININQ